MSLKCDKLQQKIDIPGVKKCKYVSYNKVCIVVNELK